jgi:hypothetical protein
MLIGAATLNSVALNSLPDTALRIQTAKEIALTELIETGGRHPLQHKRSLEYFLQHSFDKPLPREMQLYFLAMVRGFVKPPRGRPKDLSSAAREKLVLTMYTQYLKEYQAEARQRTKSQKRAVSKADRERNAPHNLAAEALAKELMRQGFPSISARHIHNLVSSQKRR